MFAEGCVIYMQPQFFRDCTVQGTSLHCQPTASPMMHYARSMSSLCRPLGAVAYVALSCVRAVHVCASESGPCSTSEWLQNTLPFAQVQAAVGEMMVAMAFRFLIGFGRHSCAMLCDHVQGRLLRQSRRD